MKAQSGKKRRPKGQDYSKAKKPGTVVGKEYHRSEGLWLRLAKKDQA